MDRVSHVAMIHLELQEPADAVYAVVLTEAAFLLFWNCVSAHNNYTGENQWNVVYELSSSLGWGRAMQSTV